MMQKIIVIEDTSILRMRITKLLQQNGYTDIVGFSSADYIERNPELYLRDINLIITDIGLPGISGIELARFLSNHPNYCNIPIVFISAYRDSKTINEAIKAGAIDYILKPFDDELFIEKIKNTLSNASLSGNNQVNCDIDEFKSAIAIEYERASRGKHPLSFIKLKVNSDDIKSFISHIKKRIRKIDMVYVFDENIVTILPLTGEVGAEVVFEKIFTELVDYNVPVLQKDFITYTPDSDKTIDDLYEILL